MLPLRVYTMEYVLHFKDFTSSTESMTVAAEDVADAVDQMEEYNEARITDPTNNVKDITMFSITFPKKESK